MPTSKQKAAAGRQPPPSVLSSSVDLLPACSIEKRAHVPLAHFYSDEIPPHGVYAAFWASGACPPPAARGLRLARSLGTAFFFDILRARTRALARGSKKRKRKRREPKAAGRTISRCRTPILIRTFRHTRIIFCLLLDDVKPTCGNYVHHLRMHAS